MFRQITGWVPRRSTQMNTNDRLFHLLGDREALHAQMLRSCKRLYTSQRCTLVHRHDLDCMVSMHFEVVCTYTFKIHILCDYMKKCPLDPNMPRFVQAPKHKHMLVQCNLNCHLMRFSSLNYKNCQLQWFFNSSSISCKTNVEKVYKTACFSQAGCH